MNWTIRAVRPVRQTAQRNSGSAYQVESPRITTSRSDRHSLTDMQMTNLCPFLHCDYRTNLSELPSFRRAPTHWTKETKYQISLTLVVLAERCFRTTFGGSDGHSAARFEPEATGSLLPALFSRFGEYCCVIARV
jgi:hypothetical protein